VRRGDSVREMLAVRSGVKQNRKKSGRFKQMKSLAKSAIMKRIKTSYQPCVVILDGTNMRGKFGFKWSKAGMAGWMDKWATTHSMNGKALIIFDNQDGDPFVEYRGGTVSICAGSGKSADDLIAEAILHLHDQGINTVVCTNDKKLMKECVAVSGVGMKTRNFFVTNDDFAKVLHMPTDYVRLRGKEKATDDEAISSALRSFAEKFPEGTLRSNAFEHSELFVGEENEKVFPDEEDNSNSDKNIA